MGGWRLSERNREVTKERNVEKFFKNYAACCKNKVHVYYRSSIEHKLLKKKKSKHISECCKHNIGISNKCIMKNNCIQRNPNFANSSKFQSRHSTILKLQFMSVNFNNNNSTQKVNCRKLGKSKPWQPRISK